MKIIVDADATPKNAMDLCRRAAQEFGVTLITVASFNHCIESEHHVITGDAPQEADLQVINLAAKGDLVITQDWGLAAMILSKGAAALSPTGRVFQEETIDFLLEERNIKAKHRRAGGRTRGPKKRTGEDDERFKKSLHRLLLDLQIP